MKKFICLCVVSLFLMTGCAVNSPTPDSQVEPTVKVEPTMSAEPTDEAKLSNDSVHKAYIEAMEAKNSKINRRKNNGKFENSYAFYDIDKNGVDELIITGGYMAYEVYTLSDNKVVDLWKSKYGGEDILIYPNKGIAFFSTGHMDLYSDTYIQITDSTVKEAAKKSWEVDPSVQSDDDDEKIKSTEYELDGKSAKQAEYDAFVEALANEEVVKHADLEWCKE